MKHLIFTKATEDFGNSDICVRGIYLYQHMRLIERAKEERHTSHTGISKKRKVYNMASSTTPAQSQPVSFTTRTPYPLPTQKFLIPTTWKRYQLSQLVNKALSLSRVVPLDFLVRGEILRASLGEWCAENGVGEVSLAVSLISYHV